MSGASDGFYVNASNYRDYSSAHLPEGEYLVRLHDLELTESKKGDPMVNAFFEVASGPYSGQPLIDRWVLIDKTLFRVVPALRALGLKVEKKNMNIPFKLLLGRTVVVKLSDGEPYNGEVRSEIRSYAPAGTFVPWQEDAAGEEAPTAVEADDTSPWDDEGGAQVAETSEPKAPASGGAALDIPEEQVTL